MVKGGFISARMREEHAKMIILMNKFQKGDADALVKLMDMQTNHAFAEEKAIMSFYNKKKDFDLLTTILEQHKELTTYLKEMGTDKKVARKYYKLMKKHIKLENSKFYPMLDNELTPDQQEEMFKEFMILFNQKVKF